MRVAYLGILALLIAAAVLAVACGSGTSAVKSIRRAADDAATLITREHPVDSTTATAAQSPPADVAAILVILDDLKIAPRGSQTEYVRSEWPHWRDADGDCQNTRAEVLIEESRDSVAFATPDDCRVTDGRWLGPWTGEWFTDASDVDIDHHVPLGHAHQSGGWRWDRERRRAYANDLSIPASLQATSASVNRTKGKQPPDAWRPDERAGWCKYAADWVSVKNRWQLTVTTAEVDALRGMLDTCTHPDSWGLAGPDGP